MRGVPGLRTSLPPPAGAAVPLRPDELDAEWLTACLHHAGAITRARVVGFQSERIGEGKGFAGYLARLALAYDVEEPGAPRTLIAKFSTAHDPTRAMLEDLGGYEKEVRFYRELADYIGIATPRCYFAHFEEAARSFLLLLEDMSPAAPCDPERGLSVAQAKYVLERLAAFHAKWWNRTGDLAWLQPSREMIEAVRVRYLTALASIGGELAEFPEFTKAARLVEEVLRGREFMRSFDKPPLTLVHSDLHPENVFLPTSEGGRFAVLDWQGLSTGRHGTADLTRILCLGMRPELRRAHEAELLTHYHEALCAAGVERFSLRKLERRYREEASSMVIIGVLALGTLDLSGPGGKEMRETFGTRLEQTMCDARLGRTLFWVMLGLRVSRWLRRLLPPWRRAP